MNEKNKPYLITFTLFISLIFIILVINTFTNKEEMIPNTLQSIDPQPAKYTLPNELIDTPEGNVSILNSCSTLESNTVYILENDIEVKTSPCFTGMKLNKITLDCRGNKILSKRTNKDDSYSDFFELIAIDELTIQNCIFESKFDQNYTLPFISEALRNRKDSPHSTCQECENLKIINNFIQGYYFIARASNGEIINNAFNDSVLNTHLLTDFNISNNTFKIKNGTMPISGAYMTLAATSDMTVTHNTFDGGSITLERPDGHDNAVLNSEGTNNIITNNYFQHFWGCPIEFSGNTSSMLVAENTIYESGICGISGWWFSSIKDSIFRNNKVIKTPQLFSFNHNNGLRPGMDTSVFFSNNIFEYNTLENSEDSIMFYKNYYSSYFDFNQINPVQTHYNEELLNKSDRYIQPEKEDFILENNIFTGNNFNTQKSIYINPKSMIIDNGNNTWDICHELVNCK